MKKIQLARGVVTLVDDEDFWPLLRIGRWRLAGNYAVSRQGVPLHSHLVMKAAGCEIDHANGQSLDNRKSNLRIATRQQNCANRRTPDGRRYKGTRLGKSGKFRAVLTVNGRFVSLGWHPTEEDAARAYDRGAREHFGEFARLNFPDEQQSNAA